MAFLRLWPEAVPVSAPRSAAYRNGPRNGTIFLMFEHGSPRSRLAATLPWFLAAVSFGCSTGAQESGRNFVRNGSTAQAQQNGNAGANLPVIRFARDPDPAPPFSLQDLDGKPLSLEVVKGKVVLVNFWATWCPPCRAEIPDLIALQKKYAGKLQIIGLSVDEGPEALVRKFAATRELNYPVAMAPAELGEKYGGIPALPTSFVLDTEGRVVQKHVGLRDPELYENEIRALLGLPVQARVETFEDMGEIFLKHADRATELPGVDFTGLSAEQKKEALHRFNAENCTCPCQLTLAQCRMNDTSCPVSKGITDEIIEQMKKTGEKPAQPAAKTERPGAPGR